jgi:hypothetical protein
VGVQQGSVLWSLLYLLYTADVPTSLKSITATFADDTAVLVTDDRGIALHKLQSNPLSIQNWFKKRERKLTDPSRSMSHSLHEKKLAPVHIDNVQLPKKKMLSITSSYILAGDLPGKNNFS